MKKIFLMFAFAFVCIGSVFAQSYGDKQWRLSVGLGYCGSESVSNGFAHGAYIGYRISQAFEVGAGFNHAISQTAGQPHAQGQWLADNPDKATIFISQDAKDTKTKHESNNTSLFALSIGVSPVKLLAENSRHDLLLSVLGGLSYGSQLWVTNSKSGMTIDTRAKGPWSYGGKIAYEYRLSENFALGASGTYDFGNSAFFGLATLNVLF